MKFFALVIFIFVFMVDVERNLTFLISCREEYEEEYRDKYAEYEKQMSTWKKQMKLRVSAFISTLVLMKFHDFQLSL